MSHCEVQIRTLPHFEGIELPQYKTHGASGLDLLAAIVEDKTIPSLERVLVPTGIQVSIPEGFEGQVRPRSGLALRDGIAVLNAPGTIDSDYRGEIQVILYNTSNTSFTLQRGMRIAQLVVAPVVKAQFVVVDNLSRTERGAGGFGHTGR